MHAIRLPLRMRIGVTHFVVVKKIAIIVPGARVAHIDPPPAVIVWPIHRKVVAIHFHGYLLGVWCPNHEAMHVSSLFSNQQSNWKAL
jgi:hypothetical protein